MDDFQKLDSDRERDKEESGDQVAQTENGAESRAFDIQKTPAEKGKNRTVSTLLKTVVIFYTIVSLVWICFAWSGKRPLYSSGPTLRRLGETYQVEITLVREDNTHLACASPKDFSGLHCAYRNPQVPWVDNPPDDGKLLRPYSTVEGEQLLGSGLWAQLDKQSPLPSHRFSVLCVFRPVAAVRSISVRWNTKASFGPVNKTVFAGSLSDCIIPK
jgi:hypothetical protein